VYIAAGPGPDRGSVAFHVVPVDQFAAADRATRSEVAAGAGSVHRRRLAMAFGIGLLVDRV
jgi:hypothetical protein